MTARIKQFKVRALPATPEPDAIYFVGCGLRLHLHRDQYVEARRACDVVT